MSRAVAPDGVETVRPVMNAINALASTVSPQHDPMYQHMARLHAPPTATMFSIQPSSSPRPAPKTPTKKPKGKLHPAGEVRDDDESEADQQDAATSGPMSIEWNMDCILSDLQIG